MAFGAINFAKMTNCRRSLQIEWLRRFFYCDVTSSIVLQKNTYNDFESTFLQYTPA